MIDLIDTRALFASDNRDSFVHAVSSWLEGVSRRFWFASAYTASKPLARAEMTATICICMLHHRLWRIAEAWNAVCRKDAGWAGKVQLIQPIFGSKVENLMDWVDELAIRVSRVDNPVVGMYIGVFRADMFDGPLGAAYTRMFSAGGIGRIAQLGPTNAVEMPGKMNFGNIDDDYRRVNKVESRLGIAEKLPLSTIATLVEPDIDPALAAEIG